MSLDETMTGLMNAARVKFPVCNELRVKDLTSILLSKNILSSNTIIEGATQVDGAFRFYLLLRKEVVACLQMTSLLP